MLLTKPRKMIISSCMLVLSAVLMCATNRAWGSIAFLGMLLSWVADAMLAQFPQPLTRLKSKSFFIGAMLFVAAHVCYIVCMMMMGQAGAYPGLPDAYILIAIPFALLCVGHWVKYFRHEESQRNIGFSIAASSYLLLVGVMATFAIRLFILSGYRYWALPLGALLFFVSDCVLVRREYRKSATRFTPYVIWGTYISAQLLLMAGLYLQ